MPRLNLVGQRFGRLEVLSQDGFSTAGATRWLCRCDCGKQTTCDRGSLRSGATKSCGCYRLENNRKNGRHAEMDLTGRRFGKLVIVEKIETAERRAWKCLCDCGGEITAPMVDLLRSRSCGCPLSRELDDMTGRQFGRLRVVGPSGRNMWRCACACGEELDASAGALVRMRSCGCARRSALLDLTGERFGRLLVVEMVPARRGAKRYCRCVCDCGTETRKAMTDLRSGHTRSCGCLLADVASIGTRVTHGATRNGRASVVGYSTWTAMKSRVLNPNHPDFPIYGGRGIKICERWMKFENFIADMGQRPTMQHSLDRINPNGNYEPGNCRWATASEQKNNQRLSAPRVVSVLDRLTREHGDLMMRLAFDLVRRELLG